MMPNQPGDSTEEINLTMGHQEPMLCKTKDCNSTYNCEKCDYVADSEESLNDHTDTHHGCVSCPTCDSKFQNEVQLKEHVYECHPTLLPEEDDSQMEVEDKDQNQEAPTLGNGKAKNFKCRHCPFQAKNKLEFWEHGTVHIKPEKMLTCPKCSFVTEYKHHLEYHLRNHFGSKPFKCNKCSYSCVNKSMLNSHLKSHSTVYQYRCLDCSYATKYCHSLKLHLRKYGHKPATVLNPDGTPNPLPIIDVYGTRRGPRPKKQKVENEKKSSVTPIPQFGQIMMNGNTVPKTTGSTLPSLCFTRPVFSQQSMKKLNSSVDDRVQYGNGIIRCNNCDFITSDRELFSQHMVQHIASEHKRQNSVSSEEPPSPESSHKSLSPSPTKNIRMSGGSLNSGYIPLDLTTSDGRPPIEKVVDHPMMHQSHDSMNVGRQVRFGSPFHDRQNYADSNGGTDRDTTSSSSSMSPDDIIVNGGNGTKSPPPLQPINETLAKFLLSNKGALVDHQRLSNMMWQRDELCVNKQYPTVDIRLPRRPQMMVPTMKNRQSPAEDSYVGRSMGNNSFWKEVHTCVYCNMAFENYSMYTMHMGYHGYANPFKCNICGHQSDDKVSFFLHIARIAHL